MKVDEGHATLTTLARTYGQLSLFDANGAETRLKVIDEMIFNVLGWHKNDVAVEERVSEDGTTKFADRLSEKLRDEAPGCVQGHQSGASSAARSRTGDARAPSSADLQGGVIIGREGADVLHPRSRWNASSTEALDARSRSLEAARIHESEEREGGRSHGSSVPLPLRTARARMRRQNRLVGGARRFADVLRSGDSAWLNRAGAFGRTRRTQRGCQQQRRRQPGVSDPALFHQRASNLLTGSATSSRSPPVITTPDVAADENSAPNRPARYPCDERRLIESIAIRPAR
jgi:hypothetical protein